MARRAGTFWVGSFGVVAACGFWVACNMGDPLPTVRPEPTGTVGQRLTPQELMCLFNGGGTTWGGDGGDAGPSTCDQACRGAPLHCDKGYRNADCECLCDGECGSIPAATCQSFCASMGCTQSDVGNSPSGGNDCHCGNCAPRAECCGDAGIDGGWWGGSGPWNGGGNHWGGGSGHWEG